jgi:hypothetical protein
MKKKDYLRQRSQYLTDPIEAVFKGKNSLGKFKLINKYK